MSSDTTLILGGLFLLGIAVGWSTEPVVNTAVDIILVGGTLAAAAAIIL